MLNAVKTINVGKDDEKLVVFDLKVRNKTGIAKVKITATGGGHTANYEMELDVRNPNPYQTTIKDFWVDAGNFKEFCPHQMHFMPAISSFRRHRW